MASLAVGSFHRSTREQHMERMRRAEQLLTVDGRSPARVVAALGEEHAVSRRQAWRYVRAIRKIYGSKGDEDLLTVQEHMRLLLARSEGALQGLKPDYSASVKALEVYARMRGWLDRRSTIEIKGAIVVGHVEALSGLSEEALARLAEFHRLAARDRQQAQPIDATATAEPASPALALPERDE